MDIVDLTDGTKYRVVHIDQISLEVIAALHIGVVGKGKEELAHQLAEIMLVSENFNGVIEFMENTKKSIEGATAISNLLRTMIEHLDKHNITSVVRMLLTVPELEYFIKLTNIPVNVEMASAAGFNEATIQHADKIMAQVREILSKSETPTEEDAKIVVINSMRATRSGNIFNTPMGKA